MARIARVVIPGVPHHIVQRGNRCQNVFFTDDEENVKEEDKKLKGFEWRIKERPLKPEDIFIKRWQFVIFDI